MDVYQIQRDCRHRASNLVPKSSQAWIVSGGTGALGLLSATFLQQNYGNEVILLGRTGRIPSDESKMQNLSLITGNMITSYRQGLSLFKLIHLAEKSCLSKGKNFKNAAFRCLVWLEFECELH